ncbi:hypothetical protein BJV82DRAFT_603688 [Fennellomyces sp. T-0311]|nr:hypothetical protein BJV82DRAFT_603688 [Fennellomyces sp. T-0311]
MEQQVTYSGWTSLEVGHMTQQYDQNFVLYRECNQQSSGLNCKIRIFDLAQSDIRDFLAQGGMCRVVVRGMMRTAPTTEPGWVQTSTRYLHVTWIVRDQGPEFLGDDIRESQSNKKLQKGMYSAKDEDEDDDDYIEGDDDEEDLGDTELEEEEEEDDDEEDDDLMDEDEEEDEEDDDDQTVIKQESLDSLNDNNKRPTSESQDNGKNKKRKNGGSS